MVRSEPPKALDSCSRMIGAPRPTLTVCRRVASTKTAPVWFCVAVRQPLSHVRPRRGSRVLTNGAGGRLAGSTSCGIEPQMSTQRSAHAPADSAAARRRRFIVSEAGIGDVHRSRPTLGADADVQGSKDKGPMGGAAHIGVYVDLIYYTGSPMQERSGASAWRERGSGEGSRGWPAPTRLNGPPPWTAGTGLGRGGRQRRRARLNPRLALMEEMSLQQEIDVRRHAYAPRPQGLPAWSDERRLTEHGAAPTTQDPK